MTGKAAGTFIKLCTTTLKLCIYARSKSGLMQAANVTKSRRDIICRSLCTNTMQEHFVKNEQVKELTILQDLQAKG